MMLVNHDNRLLLERINNVQPLYDRRIWEKDDKRNRHIVKNQANFIQTKTFAAFTVFSKKRVETKIVATISPNDPQRQTKIVNIV